MSLMQGTVYWIIFKEIIVQLLQLNGIPEYCGFIRAEILVVSWCCTGYQLFTNHYMKYI